MVDSSKASNAVVAVTAMYADIAREDQKKIFELQHDVDVGTTWFTKLGRMLEKHTRGLTIESPQQAVELAIVAVEQAAQNAVLMGRLTAALCEALVFAGSNAAYDSTAPIATLVARVSKAIVDMKAETSPSIAGIEGSTGLRELVLAASAWAVCSSPSASRPKVSRLWAAARAIGPAAVERLEREQAVLKTARTYGKEVVAQGALGDLVDAAIKLAELDLK